MSDETRLTPAASQTLAHEILRSERKRSALTASVLAFITLIVLLLTTVPGLVEPGIFEAFRPLRVVALLLMAGATLYELCAWFMLGKLTRTGGTLPGPLRYINAFIEISIPTLMLLVLMQAVGPMSALVSPAQLLYFLLITLTALQLNWHICLFAGAVAAAQYLALVHANISAETPVKELEYLVARHQYVMRGILLVIGGIVSGFVAHRTRYQLEASIRTVEERDKAISIFGQHVSPQVAEKLLNQPNEATGEERNVCVMFLDIRDFSKVASGRSPAEVMDYLNTLFGFMINVVNQHDGIINKFLGDGFMAVFGAPLDDASPGKNALMASHEILKQVEEMNDAQTIPPTRIGIGLHMGHAITGNVGSSQRKEYTIIGDSVNLAARIEQATKQFGAKLLISETVWAVVDQKVFKAEDLGPVELKGQAQPTRLFKLA